MLKGRHADRGTHTNSLLHFIPHLALVDLDDFSNMWPSDSEEVTMQIIHMGD